MQTFLDIDLLGFVVLSHIQCYQRVTAPTLHIRISLFVMKVYYSACENRQMAFCGSGAAF